MASREDHWSRTGTEPVAAKEDDRYRGPLVPSQRDAVTVSRPTNASVNEGSENTARCRPSLWMDGWMDGRGCANANGDGEEGMVRDAVALRLSRESVAAVDACLSRSLQQKEKRSVCA